MEMMQELVHTPATLGQCSPDFSPPVIQVYKQLGKMIGIYAFVCFASVYVRR